MKEISVCHGAAIKIKTESSGNDHVHTAICTECDEPCDIYHGSKEDLKAWQHHVKETGLKPGK